LHKKLPPIDELPWTISYVLRKRAQVESFKELPKDKRPPDDYIWYLPPEKLDEWFDRVLYKDSPKDEVIFEIDESEIG
jgi:hypothetical protein